jgi:hypothetical protein
MTTLLLMVAFLGAVAGLGDLIASKRITKLLVV